MMIMSFFGLTETKIEAELHIYLQEGTYHTRLFRGPSTNDMKMSDGPSRSWPTPRRTTPFFLPPEGRPGACQPGPPSPSLDFGLWSQPEVFHGSVFIRRALQAVSRSSNDGFSPGSWDRFGLIQNEGAVRARRRQLSWSQR
jgi:hypothetical protein